MTGCASNSTSAAPWRSSRQWPAAPPQTFRIDKEMYKWRHLIENFFQKIKEFRRIATRYDKTDTSYAATIHLAAAIIASVALPILRVLFIMIDLPSVAAAYVYSGQLGLGLRVKMAADINLRGKRNCSASTAVAFPSWLISTATLVRVSCTQLFSLDFPNRAHAAIPCCQIQHGGTYTYTTKCNCSASTTVALALCAISVWFARFGVERRPKLPENMLIWRLLLVDCFARYAPLWDAQL